MEYKIELKSMVFGQYEWSVSGNVDEKLIPFLLNAGGTNILQRTPSTEAEKSMAGYGKNRPKDFRRNSIPYTPEGVNTLTRHIIGAEVVIGKDDKGKDITVPLFGDDAVCNVTEHVMTEPKLDDERVKYASKTTPEDRKALMDTVGYTGEYGDGTKENAPVELLKAIRRYTTEKAKAALAGI